MVFWITFVLQILKLFIFTTFGSGDVQAWDSYDSKRDCDMEGERRARFTVAGDTTDDSNENSDNDSTTTIDTSDSELLLK